MEPHMLVPDSNSSTISSSLWPRRPKNCRIGRWLGSRPGCPKEVKYMMDGPNSERVSRVSSIESPILVAELAPVPGSRFATRPGGTWLNEQPGFSALKPGPPTHDGLNPHSQTCLLLLDTRAEPHHTLTMHGFIPSNDELTY